MKTDRVNIAIDTDLKRRFKSKCALEGKTIREALESLLRGYLDDKADNSSNGADSVGKR